jgi:hypothetical protein
MIEMSSSGVALSETTNNTVFRWYKIEDDLSLKCLTFYSDRVSDSSAVMDVSMIKLSSALTNPKHV